LVFVAVAAGQVQPEVPMPGRAAIPQPDQRLHGPIRQVRFDVDERTPVAKLQLTSLRPVRLGVGTQSLPDIAGCETAVVGRCGGCGAPAATDTRPARRSQCW
jgi:hypothetical protein